MSDGDMSGEKNLEAQLGILLGLFWQDGVIDGRDARQLEELAEGGHNVFIVEPFSELASPEFDDATGGPDKAGLRVITENGLQYEIRITPIQ